MDPLRSAELRDRVLELLRDERRGVALPGSARIGDDVEGRIGDAASSDMDLGRTAGRVPEVEDRRVVLEDASENATERGRTPLELLRRRRRRERHP
jgi:hypothetical protein